MKNLKAIIVICLALLTQVVFAGEWNQLEVNREGYLVKVSYTKRFVTPTYGTNGGVMTGKLFVDLYTNRASLAQKVEILEVYQNGSRSVISRGTFNEDTQSHHWVQLDKGGYAGTLAIGPTYLLELTVDGRIVEMKIKLN